MGSLKTKADHTLSQSQSQSQSQCTLMQNKKVDNVEREREKYTSRRKVVEDVSELEGAVTNVEGVVYTMPTMCHPLSLYLPCWVPFHHLRPCLPRQRCQRCTITVLPPHTSHKKRHQKSKTKGQVSNLICRYRSPTNF